MTETLDDKFLAEKKAEQDEFDDAFDEIEGKDPELHKALHGDDKLLNKDTTTGDSLSKHTDGGTTPTKEELDKKAAEEAEAKAKAEAVAKKEADAHLDNTATEVNTDLFTGLKKPATDGTDGTDPKDIKIAELEAALTAEQQKTSSWNGRIKASNDKATELEAKNADLEKRLAALESGDTATTKTATTGDKNEQVAKFFSDFPEFEAPIRALIAEAKAEGKGVTIDEVKEAIRPDLEEVRSTVTETSSQDAFMRGLVANHADVQTYIGNGAILKWIDQQPAYIAKELTRVYNGGTVEEATTLVDEFKRTSSEYKPDTSEHTNTQQNDKLKSMMEVDSDSAGPPAGQPDKNDFDAGAADAFKDE